MLKTEPKLLIEEKYALGDFFQRDTREKYTSAIIQGLSCVNDFLKRDTFYSGATQAELSHLVEQVHLKNAPTCSLEEALEELKHLYLDHTIAFHQPTYAAHLNCPVLIPTLAAEVIANAVNTAVETWDQSTSAALIEEEIIHWICREMGFTSTSDGVFTSGGTQSNLMGLLMARDAYAEKELGINIKKDGLTPEMNRFRIFCSDKAHYSIQKNAALLGLGYQAVIPVATDATYKMDLAALEQAIQEELQNGNIPIAIVATAGTTDFGSIDPLAGIAELAQQYNLWLHTDAAYGGSLVVSEKLKHLLNGISYSDSITIDFHKGLFQPVCSSVFLLQNKEHFKYTSQHVDYLNPIETAKKGVKNLVVKSLQTTRRFDALKLWLTLRVTGQKALGYFLETIHETAREVHAHLQLDTAFETLHQPEISTIVFRYTSAQRPESEWDSLNMFIKNTLFNSGQAAVASTKVDSKVYLKFTFLNPCTTIEDIQYIINLIKETATLYEN